MTSNKFYLLDPDYINELNLKTEEINKETNNIIHNKLDSKNQQKKLSKKALAYDDKINLISSYFGISEICAKYLFHRRYRGFPFHKKNDPKFLAWSITLQNAIILLDTLVGFDWETLEFGYEELVFNKYDINIENIEDDPIRLVEEVQHNINSQVELSSSEWQEISNNHTVYELTKMGLLPKSYREWKPSNKFK